MSHKKTKIICTLGPACNELETIHKMVKAGMNVARLNFSHGSHDDHLDLLKKVRQVEEDTTEPVAVIQDLQGPKLRLGVLPAGGIVLKTGETVSFETGLVGYSNGIIPIDYATLHEYVKAGERILLSDGKLEIKIIRISDNVIHTEVVVGGKINSHAGINLPDSKLNIGSLTEKDKEDLRFGVVHEVDYVAISFVRGPEDILDVRFLIAEYEKEMGIIPEQPIRIIAKIERHDAVNNIKQILEVTDGIMVARGDLGVEIPAEDVPLVQKRLIDESLKAGKPVIVATQMLDSMQENPRPTRAEVSDVANAVIDHTDAVMLSNETAMGKYPVETVKTMAAIVLKAESSLYDDLPKNSLVEKQHRIDNIICRLGRDLAEEVGAKVILSASISGDTGRLISKYRPNLPVIVGASTKRVQRQLNLSWGVVPFVLVPCNFIEELVERAMVNLKKHKFVEDGDTFVLVAGEPVGEAGHVNLLEVRKVE